MNTGRSEQIKMRKTFGDKYHKVIFIAPAVIAVGIVLVFPLSYTLYLSLHHWFMANPDGPRFIGLENYYRILRDEHFYESLLTTVKFMGLATITQTVLGTGMALVFNRAFKGKGMIRTFFALPLYATPVAIALVWMMFFEPTLGILNYLLKLVGLPPSLWVASPTVVIPSLVLVDTWQWTPLIMFIVLAGLAMVPDEAYEAAHIDGASGLQTFVHVTLPLIRPTIISAVTFRIIDALKTFDIIYIITQGGPGRSSETLVINIFKSAFEGFQIGYGSALVVILGMIVLLFTMVLGKARKVA